LLLLKGAVKPKGGTMERRYEIGYILTPEVTEEAIGKIKGFITKIIEEAEGKIERTDEWGRKRLAYPIKKFNDGIYTFITTEVNGAAIAKIERRLKLSEEVIRFVVIRLDERLQKSNRFAKRWRRVEKLQKRRAEVEAEAREQEEGKNASE
jgi:small subunit ribosomal protein S6